MMFEDLNPSVQHTILKSAKENRFKLFYKRYDWHIRFTKQTKNGIVRIDIYWNKKARITRVGTSMNHPKKGKTQLFRKINSLSDIEKIFNNPRVHSGKGYYKK